MRKTEKKVEVIKRMRGAYKFMEAPEKTLRKIGQKEAEIYRLRASCLPGAICYDKEKVETSPDDSLSRVLSEVADLTGQISRLRDRYEIERMAQMAVLELMPDRLMSEVLFRRYLKRQAYDEIAQEMGLHIRRVYRLHKEGLEWVQDRAISNYHIWA